MAVSLLGIYLAYQLYYKKASFAHVFSNEKMNNFFLHGWGFDRLYDTIFVRPVVYLSEINKNDFIDLINKWIAGLMEMLNRYLSFTQNGKLRWYIVALAFGIVFILTILIK
jgi:NADH-quinone oxidoreductase subunit L